MHDNMIMKITIYFVLNTYPHLQLSRKIPLWKSFPKWAMMVRPTYPRCSLAPWYLIQYKKLSSVAETLKEGRTLLAWTGKILICQIDVDCWALLQMCLTFFWLMLLIFKFGNTHGNAISCLHDFWLFVSTLWFKTVPNNVLMEI